MKDNIPAISIIGEDRCTGCFGCYSSCPIDAIEMIYSDDGFYIPKIKDKCNNCGVCQENCPVIRHQSNPIKFKQPIFYGGKSNDKETLLNSSSGGLFPEMAKYILENDGVVFGAYLNEKLHLKHIKIQKKGQLIKIMGSKYIQSDIGDSYKEVLKELKMGKTVLFAGTPCQIAALNTFIESDDLYTVDLACHGVPSKILFDKYVKYMERKKGTRVKHVNFRDKKKGWKDFQMKITFKDCTVHGKNHKFDPFFRAFLPNLCLMKSCYECKFNVIPRPGDISLGDFWGDPPTEITDQNGVSVILANNKKAKKLISKLEKAYKIQLCKTDFETATKGNPRLKGHKFEVPAEREKFLHDLKNHDFETIEKKYIITPNPIKYRINSYIRKLLKYIR